VTEHAPSLAWTPGFDPSTKKKCWAGGMAPVVEYPEFKPQCQHNKKIKKKFIITKHPGA
jgi:hypothetical protein